MNARGLVCCLVLIGAAAASVAAQQAGSTPLGDVAREAEAARKTQMKAQKTYSNADLSADPRAKSGPVEESQPGFMSATLGRPVTAEEMLDRSEAKADAEEKADRSLPQEYWRGQAASIRGQLEKAQQRKAILTRPNEARHQAAQERNDAEILKVQRLLDDLTKSWNALEGAARLDKIPSEWLDPRPRQPS